MKETTGWGGMTSDPGDGEKYKTDLNLVYSLGTRVRTWNLESILLQSAHRPVSVSIVCYTA